MLGKHWFRMTRLRFIALCLGVFVLSSVQAQTTQIWLDHFETLGPTWIQRPNSTAWQFGTVDSTVKFRSPPLFSPLCPPYMGQNFAPAIRQAMTRADSWHFSSGFAIINASGSLVPNRSNPVQLSTADWVGGTRNTPLDRTHPDARLVGVHVDQANGIRVSVGVDNFVIQIPRAQAESNWLGGGGGDASIQFTLDVYRSHYVVKLTNNDTGQIRQYQGNTTLPVPRSVSLGAPSCNTNAYYNEFINGWVWINVKNVPPVVSHTILTAPVPTTTNLFNQSVDIRITATEADGNGIDRIQYSWQGPTTAVQTVTAPNSHPLTFSTVVTRNPEGQHTLWYRAIDAGGNSSNWQQVTFAIDKFPPTTTAYLNRVAVQPVNGWYTSAPDLEFTVSDSSGLYPNLITTLYRLTLEGNTSTFNYSGGVVSIPGEGEITLEYRSVDAFGNTENMNSVLVRIDKQAPSITERYNNAGLSTGWYNSDVNIQLTTSDAVTGVSLVSGVKANSLQYREWVGGVWSAWMTYPATGIDLVTHGVHQLQYRVEDNAGNVYTTPTRSIQIDKVPPTSVLAAGVNGATQGTGSDGNLWFNQVPKIRIMGTDGDSGIREIIHQINGGTATISSVNPSEFDLTASGVYTITYYAVDNASNQETPSNTDTVRVDITPPQSQLQFVQYDAVYSNPSGEQWFNSAVDVALSAQDVHNAVDDIEYRLDGGAWTSYTDTIRVSGDGSHLLEYRAQDILGNVEAIQSQVIRIDTTPPISSHSIAPPAGGGNVVNGWYVVPPTISLSSVDANAPDSSGVAIIASQLNSDPPQVYTAPIPITTEGVHTLGYLATDYARNSEAPNEVQMQVDLNPPTTTATYNGAALTTWYPDNVQVDLIGTDAASGIDRVEYNLDGAGVQVGTSLVVSGHGDHTLSYQSVDIAGWQETLQTDTFKIDAIAPESTITVTALGDPPINGWYDETPQISLNATDIGSGVDKILVSVNGQAPTTYTVPFVPDASGRVVIRYRAVDLVGNFETMHTEILQVDTTAPDNGIIETVQNRWYCQALNLTLWAQDAQSGVDTLRYRINNEAWQTYTTPLNFAQDGWYVLEYDAIDLAGHRSATSRVEFGIDRSQASLTHTYGDPQWGANNWFVEPVHLRMWGNDAESGVQQLQYRLIEVDRNTGGHIAYGDWVTTENGRTATFNSDSKTYRLEMRAKNGCAWVYDSADLWVDHTPPQMAGLVCPTAVQPGTTLTFGIGGADDHSGFWQAQVELVTVTGLTGEYLAPIETDRLYNIPTLGEGAHTYTVRLLDRAGNVSPQSMTCTVQVNTSAPSATPTLVPSNTPLPTNTLTPSPTLTPSATSSPTLTPSATTTPSPTQTATEATLVWETATPSPTNDDWLATLIAEVQQTADAGRWTVTPTPTQDSLITTLQAEIQQTARAAGWTETPTPTEDSLIATLQAEIQQTARAAGWTETPTPTQDSLIATLQAEIQQTARAAGWTETPTHTPSPSVTPSNTPPATATKVTWEGLTSLWRVAIPTATATPTYTISPSPTWTITPSITPSATALPDVVVQTRSSQEVLPPSDPDAETDWGIVLAGGVLATTALAAQAVLAAGRVKQEEADAANAALEAARQEKNRLLQALQGVQDAFAKQQATAFIAGLGASMCLYLLANPQYQSLDIAYGCSTDLVAAGDPNTAILFAPLVLLLPVWNRGSRYSVPYRSLMSVLLVGILIGMAAPAMAGLPVDTTGDVIQLAPPNWHEQETVTFVTNYGSVHTDQAGNVLDAQSEHAADVVRHATNPSEYPEPSPPTSGSISPPVRYDENGKVIPNEARTPRPKTEAEKLAEQPPAVRKAFYELRRYDPDITVAEAIRFVEQTPCVTLTHDQQVDADGNLVYTFTATEQIQGASVEGYVWEYPEGMNCVESGNTLQCTVPPGTELDVGVVPLGGIGEGKRVTQTVTDDGGSNTLNLVAGTALGLGLLSILVSTYGLTKDAGQLLLGLLGQPQPTTTPITEAEQAQIDQHLELRRILGGLNDGYFDPSWADLSSDELQIRINDMLGDNAVENAPIESVVPGSDHIAYPRQFVESLQRRFHEATLGPADPGRALTAFTMTFLFVASIFVEPIDWAVTAVSVAECAAAEDWECVGTEMALVFLPGAVGALGDAGRNVNKIDEIADVGDEVADEVVDVFDDTTGANSFNDRTVDPGGGGGPLPNRITPKTGQTLDEILPDGTTFDDIAAMVDDQGNVIVDTDDTLGLFARANEVRQVYPNSVIPDHFLDQTGRIVPRSKNVGLAYLDIDGVEGASEYVAISGTNSPPGTIPKISADNLTELGFDIRPHNGIRRDVDTEVQLLGNIIQDNANRITETTEGTLVIYTNRAPCYRCGGSSGVEGNIGVFKELYPNIQVVVISTTP